MDDIKIVNSVSGFKKDCLFCEELAVQEVIHPISGAVMNHVRFCNSEKCKEKALGLANHVVTDMKVTEVVEG